MFVLLNEQFPIKVISLDELYELVGALRGFIGKSQELVLTTRTHENRPALVLWRQDVPEPAKVTK